MSCPFQTALALSLHNPVVRTNSSRVRFSSLLLRLIKAEMNLNWFIVIKVMSVTQL